MLLVVGLAAGLALARWVPRGGDEAGWLLIWTVLVGGLSLVGLPLVILDRRRRGRQGFRTRPSGPGQILWLSTGTAAWLLWPPIVMRTRAAQPNQMLDGGTATICFAYGTPLMALYVTIALLLGGHFRRGSRGRRLRRRRSWTETFGLILGLLWAATGLYVLAMIYLDDLR
jgi:hypothetical protein